MHKDESRQTRRLALVLGGGGSKGALQVGLYKAMWELGVRPDLIVGTSVGALNGAFIAAEVDPATLATGWSKLSGHRLFGLNWQLLWRGPYASSVFSSSRLLRFLREHLPVTRFEDLRIPLSLITTHLGSGEACVWERGSLPRAVVASCSVPGILPPVKGHDGIPHVDGSLADNLPIDIALGLGATHAIAMNCRTCDRCTPWTGNLVGVVGAAFSVAADCKLRLMADQYSNAPNILLLQPEIGELIRALDFSHGRRLVEAGYEYSLPRLKERLAEWEVDSLRKANSTHRRLPW